MKGEKEGGGRREGGEGGIEEGGNWSRRRESDRLLFLDTLCSFYKGGERMSVWEKG